MSAEKPVGLMTLRLTVSEVVDTAAVPGEPETYVAVTEAWVAEHTLTQPGADALLADLSTGALADLVELTKTAVREGLA